MFNYKNGCARSTQFNWYYGKRYCIELNVDFIHCIWWCFFFSNLWLCWFVRWFLSLSQDIQFKLHSKYQLFNVNASTPNYNGIDLLATASAYGLIIVGRPSTNEIQGLFVFDCVCASIGVFFSCVGISTKSQLQADHEHVHLFYTYSCFQILVLRLNDAVQNAETSNISVRSIYIPGEPYVLALSCDHTMLAVCYTMNRQSFMDVYAVQTFLSAVSSLNIKINWLLLSTNFAWNFIFLMVWDEMKKCNFTRVNERSTQ